MLIQNNSNMAQAPMPAKPASDSAPDVMVATPSNLQSKPSASVELPRVAVKQAAEQQPSTEQLKNVVDNINKVLKQSNKNLEFSVDSETNKQLVKLVDTESGEVIRQFPSEEAMIISRSIEQFQQGMLLKQEA
ncbi:MAG: flagellar protein FlaG [Gallionella sp.]|nr:flagellar protein FlaG [Gallionella sp.]